MLKWIGIFFILAGTGGFGHYMGVYLNRHFEQLVECQEIFAQMDSAREYLRLPYAQLLRKTAKGKGEMFAGTLCEIADEMEQNREADAGILWKAAFEKRKRQVLLKKEEQDLLFALARCLMLEGNHAKIAQIYFVQLEDKIRKAMEEKKEKQKLYHAASILGGLFLVILLL